MHGKGVTSTEKGMALLSKATGSVEAADEDIKKRQQVWDKNEKALNNHKLSCKPSELLAPASLRVG